MRKWFYRENITDGMEPRIRFPWRLILAFSGVMVSLSLAWWGTIRHWEICVAGAAVLLCCLCLRGRFVESAFAIWHKGYALVSLGIALCVIGFISYNQPTCFALLKWLLRERLALPARMGKTVFASLESVVGVGATVLLLPALFVYAYWFVRWFAKQICHTVHLMTRADRVYLWVFGLMLTGLLMIAFQSSNAFYEAQVGEEPFDILYTSDSGVLFQQNVYGQINAIENDLRQPLFGLFTLPFAAVAMRLAQLMPAATTLYPTLMGVLQLWLILWSVVLLRQMLGLQGAQGCIFLVLTTALYPTLLFSLMLEQYAFAVLWLLLLVHAHLTGTEDRDLLYTAAAGSLLTSAVLLPLVPTQPWGKAYAKQLLRAMGVFVGVLILSGRFGGVLNAATSLRWLAGQFITQTQDTFSVAHALPDRLLQYTHFVAACFVAPATIIETARHGYITWQLAPVTAINLLGSLLLVLAGVGFALNRKNRLAQISMGWIVFSFLLLAVVGWGAKENGMTLYTYYFAWAFVCLLVLGVEKLLNKWATLRIGVYGCAAIALLVINIQGITRLINFALEHYPVG